jgi:hypothetical protein
MGVEICRSRSFDAGCFAILDRIHYAQETQMNKLSPDDTVYISGPMSGMPNFNRELFDYTENILVSSFGIRKIINPGKIPADWTWEQAMEKDIDDVTNLATHLVLLNGWENSRGARIEVKIALERGLPITTFESLLAEIIARLN